MSFARRFVMMPALSVIESVVSGLIAFPVVGLFVNLCLSWCASASRGFKGGQAAVNLELCRKPEKMIIFYQYEGCPFCRRVRENLSALAIDVLVYPCPRVTLGEYGVVAESRYRPVVQQLLGKCIFPVIIDPNFPSDGQDSRGLVIQDSAKIVDHLWRNYGDKSTPLQPSTGVFLSLPVLFRPLPGMGVLVTPSKLPQQPLELYSYEHEYHCRLIRERLDSLELPYIVHNITPGARHKEREYMARFKTTEITFPRLLDPNILVPSDHNDRDDGNNSSTAGAGVMVPLNLTDTASILLHLKETYALGDTKAGSWTSYSTKGATAQHGVIQ